MQKLNSWINATLPSINQNLNKGIENPFIGFFGLKEIDITMGDSFMSLGVVLNEWWNKYHIHILLFEDGFQFI